MKAFIEYLKTEKHKAENTLIAYGRDLSAFESFLLARNDKGLSDCEDSDAVAYILSLNKTNKSKATINRTISAIRAYYDYLVVNGKRKDNPFDKIKSARIDTRQIDYLSVEEAAQLMDLPAESFSGLRDKALLEFMYGTGARVSEVVRIKYEDINLKMNFATIREGNSESRIVPIGSHLHNALSRYFEEAYPSFKGGRPEPGDYVFINSRGGCLTRQGIWRLLRDYGEMIGAGERMSPQILRDTFAVHILQNGGDIRTLQELMGFDNMSVGLAYLAVIDIHVREVYKKTHPRA